MSKVINVPQPGMSDYGRVQFATEVAFSSLIRQAAEIGLELSPVMGLMYLSSQQLTRDFQLACRAILSALAVAKPSGGSSE